MGWIAKARMTMDDVSSSTHRLDIISIREPNLALPLNKTRKLVENALLSDLRACNKQLTYLTWVPTLQARPFDFRRYINNISRDYMGN